MRVLNKPFTGKDDNEDLVVAMVTDEVDLRMLVQSSGITAHGSQTPLDDQEKLSPVLQRLEIPADRKPVLLRQLVGLGIRERTLFPDLGHLASDLTAEWERKVAPAPQEPEGGSAPD